MGQAFEPGENAEEAEEDDDGTDQEGEGTGYFENHGKRNCQKIRNGVRQAIGKMAKHSK